MEGENDAGAVIDTGEDDTCSAVNKLILDYYKKFGRKRDLEQYFSLSTAQNDLRDPTGSFWRKMKTQDDSSDSGGKKSESSQELCRISIRCSLPDPSSSQDDNTKTKSNSESPPKSPPIIVDDGIEYITKNSDDEDAKSDDNNSQKSLEIMDTSINPRSPTSSITSQRKLEWDSLADVGYANESDRKNSASSLSTLEKLALKQQFSNNDTEKDSKLGLPTAQSTPLEDDNIRSKLKKGVVKKTKFYKKDVDFVEVNVPQDRDNPPQTINVNLTKHMSFNVKCQKDGGITVENVINDINVENSSDKVPCEDEIIPQDCVDKEIQTSFVKTTDKSVNSDRAPKTAEQQKNPVIISLNTLKKRKKNRLKKARNTRKKSKTKRKNYIEKSKVYIQNKSGEQLSEAESFEYMPGHVYNQNHLMIEQPKLETADNKSSLESSGLPTTDSSKSSKHSFKKDLEKSINLLRIALQERYNDDNLKKKLIKEVIQRLLNSTYRDDETTTDFLSGLSFKSVKIGLRDSNQTTSTSEGNTLNKAKKRPKKSILRMDKFNSNAIASTSQSTPNLPVVTNNDKLCTSKLVKSLILSHTDTDGSSREKFSSDNGFAKTSSEELYQKYLQAVKKEEAYKKHLREKEILLKQKLRSSDKVFKIPPQMDNKVNNRMKELMKDLTRNNYDDGSGDANKLGDSSNYVFERYNHSQKSHSVFTLSSDRSQSRSMKQNQAKQLQGDVKDLNKAGPSKRDHYCCCPHHSSNIKGVADTSVQVNIRDSSLEKYRNQIDDKSVNPQGSTVETGKNAAHFVSDIVTGDVKYVCLCNNQTVAKEVPNNFLIYKCSRLSNIGVQSDDMFCKPHEIIALKSESNINNTQQSKPDDHFSEAPPSTDNSNRKVLSVDSSSSLNIPIKKPSKSSQTNLFLKMLCGKSSDGSVKSSRIQPCGTRHESSEVQSKKILLHEATRCLQTEISINPKISDPHLSDINIVSDIDCFKLISEQYREVSRSSSEIDSRHCEVQSDADTCASNEDVKLSISKESNTSLDTDLLKIKSETHNINLRDPCNISMETNNIPDNFTIPIQGTNMMLMVKIGSNVPTSEANAKQNELINQGIETEKLYNIDKSTSLIEECSKSAQTNNSTRDEDINNDENRTTKVKVTRKSAKDPFKVQHVVKICEVLKNKFNTYPKEGRKTFLRSNTNSEMIDSNNYSQDVFASNVESQDTVGNINSAYIENKITKLDEDNLEPLCPCGCNFKIHKFKGDYGEMKENNNAIKSKAVVNVNMPTDMILNHQSDSFPKNTDDNDLYYDKSDHFKLMTIEEQSIANIKDIHIQKDLQPVSIDLKETNMSIFRLGHTENLKSSDKSQLRDDKESFQFNIEKNKFTNINDEQKTKQAKTGTKTNLDHKLSHNSDNNSDKNDQNIPSSTEVAVDTQDPVLNMIKDITKRYSKTDIEKNKRKKCFKEIVTVLNYLLDTDDSSDNKEFTKDYGNCSSQKSKESETEYVKVQDIVTDPDCAKSLKTESRCASSQTKVLVDKAVQLTHKKKKLNRPTIEISDFPTSTDVPETSTDSATCKVLNKIKKECEKYHQKRCKSYSGKICEASSSNSVNCEKCRRVHHCSCRNHKCKRSKSDNPKKPVAYNLIIQTSESMISEETICSEQCRTLKNIVVKVPSRYKKLEKAPFKEVASKIEHKMAMTQSPKFNKTHRSRSLSNDGEISSSGDLKGVPSCTIRDYLERNRPDFVENCSQRQNCLKYVSESRNEDACNKCATSNLKMIVIHTPSCSNAMARCNMYCGGVPMPCSSCINSSPRPVQNEVTRLANERAAHRDLLSMHVDRESPLSALSLGELRRLAKEIGIDASTHKQPRLISEKEMKKHSEKIYKSLPEVVQKKEQLNKENIKKTNLLMASIFKKNLQKKTLRGSVNLSNYSTVIKI